MNLLWILPHNKLSLPLLSYTFINRELISLIKLTKKEKINLFIYSASLDGVDPQHNLNKPIFEYNQLKNNSKIYYSLPTKKNFYKLRHFLQYFGGTAIYPFFWSRQRFKYTYMKWFFKTYLSLNEVIKKNKIDLVHTHLLDCVEPLIAIKKKYNFKLLNTYHGGDIYIIKCNLGSRGQRVKNKGHEDFLKKSLPFIDIHLPVSYWLSSFLNDFKIDETKIKVLHNGIDVNEFNLIQFEQNTPLVILSYKRTKNTYLAAKEVLKRIPSLNFVMMGAKATTEEESLIKTLGIKDNFKFLGEVSADKVNSVISRSDIILHPSWCDACSIFILEAMASGKPVIGSDGLGIAEEILDGKTGFLVNQFDYKNIANAILKLAKNKKLRIKMGKAGRKRVESYFINDNKIRGYISIYKKLLKNKSSY